MVDVLQEGLQRQLQSLERCLARGERQAGWKVGLTSGRSRDAMGKGFRPFGFVIESRVVASGSSIPLSAFRRPGIENELCFTFARPLRGDATRDQVMTALESVSPAFEIVEQRLDRGSPAEAQLADNLSHWGIVVGTPRELDWRSYDFRALCPTLRDDAGTSEQVTARGHIDDHLDSLAALTRQLAGFNRGIGAGDRVITGSYTGRA